MFGLQALASYLNPAAQPIVIEDIELPEHVNRDDVAIFTDSNDNAYEAYVNYTIHNGHINITFYDWILDGGTWRTLTVAPQHVRKITWREFTKRISQEVA